MNQLQDVGMFQFLHGFVLSVESFACQTINLNLFYSNFRSLVRATVHSPGTSRTQPLTEVEFVASKETSEEIHCPRTRGNRTPLMI